MITDYASEQDEREEASDMEPCGSHAHHWCSFRTCRRWRWSQTACGNLFWGFLLPRRATSSGGHIRYRGGELSGRRVPQILGLFASFAISWRSWLAPHCWGVPHTSLSKRFTFFPHLFCWIPQHTQKRHCWRLCVCLGFLQFSHSFGAGSRCSPVGYAKT